MRSPLPLLLPRRLEAHVLRPRFPFTTELLRITRACTEASVSIVYEGADLPGKNCWRRGVLTSEASWLPFRPSIHGGLGGPEASPCPLAATCHGTTHRGHWHGRWINSDRGLGKGCPKSTPAGTTCLDTHTSLWAVSGTRGSQPFLPSSPKLEPSSGHHSRASVWNATSRAGPALQGRGFLLGPASASCSP